MLLDRLLLARKGLRLTLQQLAARIGLRREALHAYESGEMVPPLEHLQRLAEETGKPAWWFLLPSDPLEFEKHRALFIRENELVGRLRQVLSAFRGHMLKVMDGEERASWEELSGEQLYSVIRAGRLSPLGADDLRKVEQYLRDPDSGPVDALVYLFAVWARPRFPGEGDEADYVRRIHARLQVA